MRNVVLAAAVAGFVAVAPAAAQVVKPAARTAEARRSRSREVFVAVLSGAYAVPAVETRATGTAELTLVGSRLQYRVDVGSIGDVTGVYVHVGGAGEETPAVADLFEGVRTGPVSGVLASGMLQPAHLHGITTRQLIRALCSDDAYVTVHTLTHPGGELRGQLRLQPLVASR